MDITEQTFRVGPYKPFKRPGSLKPNLINKVVSIQIIPRESPESDTVLPEKMLRIVGTLEAYLYSADKPLVYLHLRGDKNMTRIDLETHSLEIYVASD